MNRQDEIVYLSKILDQIHLLNEVVSDYFNFIMLALEEEQQSYDNTEYPEIPF